MFYDFQLPNQVYMTVSRPGKRILNFHDYKAVMGNWPKISGNNQSSLVCPDTFFSPRQTIS